MIVVVCVKTLFHYYLLLFGFISINLPVGDFWEFAETCSTKWRIAGWMYGWTVMVMARSRPQFMFLKLHLPCWFTLCFSSFTFHVSGLFMCVCACVSYEKSTVLSCFRGVRVCGRKHLLAGLTHRQRERMLIRESCVNMYIVDKRTAICWRLSCSLLHACVRVFVCWLINNISVLIFIHSFEMLI